MLCSKNSDQLPVLNTVIRLIDIFAVGKFDYGVMERCQNLTRRRELSRAPLARAPLGPGLGAMYPLNLPLAGPVSTLQAIRFYSKPRLLVKPGCFWCKNRVSLRCIIVRIQRSILHENSYNAEEFRREIYSLKKKEGKLKKRYD